MDLAFRFTEEWDLSPTVTNSTHLLNELFLEILDGFFMVYIDDIIVYDDGEKEYLASI